jgi:hypothetical protein
VYRSWFYTPPLRRPRTLISRRRINREAASPLRRAAPWARRLRILDSRVTADRPRDRMVNLRRIRLHATVHARARILIQRLLPYRLRKRLTRRRTTRRASLNLRIAETFNVTIDYLVIPGAPAGPCTPPAPSSTPASPASPSSTTTNAPSSSASSTPSPPKPNSASSPPGPAEPARQAPGGSAERLSGHGLRLPRPRP